MKRSAGKPKDLVIFPFGGNAREAVAAVLAINKVRPTWKILGFVDGDPKNRHKSYAGLRVLGGPELLNTTLRGARVLAVPGNPRSFAVRKKIIDALRVSDDRWATIVDPSVRTAPDVSVGRNTLILAGGFVGASAVIGDHCVALPHAVVQHDAVVENHAILGAQVIVSGSCKIGRQSYIGSGSRILHGVTIGQGSMVGIGSVVLKDVASGVVVAGCPARQLDPKR